MNSRKIIKKLKADGWIFHHTKGDHHQFKHPAIGCEIAFAQVAHVGQGAGEDVKVLVNAAVGDCRLGAGCEFKVLLGPVAEEENLQMKRPGAHIGVEIRKIGVVGH